MHWMCTKTTHANVSAFVAILVGLGEAAALAEVEVVTDPFSRACRLVQSNKFHGHASTIQLALTLAFALHSLWSR